MTIGTNQVTFIVQGKNISIPNKESYENKVQDKIANVDELELSIEKLDRLKKIVRHANLHGLEIIHDIK
jgi:cell division protein FtsL